MKPTEVLDPLVSQGIVDRYTKHCAGRADPPLGVLATADPVGGEVG